MSDPPCGPDVQKQEPATDAILGQGECECEGRREPGWRTSAFVVQGRVNLVVADGNGYEDVEVEVEKDYLNV